MGDRLRIRELLIIIQIFNIINKINHNLQIVNIVNSKLNSVKI
jgi:hypothetical protein